MQKEFSELHPKLVYNIFAGWQFCSFSGGFGLTDFDCGVLARFLISYDIVR